MDGVLWLAGCGMVREEWTGCGGQWTSAITTTASINSYGCFFYLTCFFWLFCYVCRYDMVFLFIIYLLCGYFNPFLLTLIHLFLPFPFSSPHSIVYLNNPFCFCFLLSMYDMSAVFGSPFHFVYFLFGLGGGWVGVIST